MLELEVLEFLMQSLMLADLAHVVLFHDDTHATRNAWREVRSTVLAIDVTTNI